MRVPNAPMASAPLRFGASIQKKRLPDGGMLERYDDIVLIGAPGDENTKTPHRTAFTKLLGSFAKVPAAELQTIAMKGLLDACGIEPKDVDQVILGNIVTNEENQSFIHKQVARLVGVPDGHPAHTVNRLCGTGFEVVRQAAHELANGGDGIILTGGVENMSRAAVLDNSVMLDAKRSKLKGMMYTKFPRWATRPFITLNPLEKGLTDPAIKKVMYQTADELAKRYGITKEDAVYYAYESQKRAADAIERGLIANDIIPVHASNPILKEGRLPRGVNVIDKDEHPRGKSVKADSMIKLPMLDKDNPFAIHNAATSSGTVDGSSAMIASTGEWANDHGLNVLATLKASAVVGVDPEIMGIGPARAVKEILKDQDLSLDDIDWIDINEAFAGQALAVAHDLTEGMTGPEYKRFMAKFNKHGSGIPFGHPIAATGGRIIGHVANNLAPGQKAIVGACIGGGQGIIMLLEKPAKSTKQA
jgi:acetyl-CoA acetyltransferase family protein